MTYEGSVRLGDLFESRREKGRAGLPLLSVTMNDGLVDRDDLDRKQETSLAPEEHLLVKPGDIAYNMMRMWQGASGLAEKEGLVSPAYVVVTPRPCAIDPAYASYLFKSKRVTHLFWAYSYGLTDDRLRLYEKDFARVPVELPSLSNQQKFSRILKTWDKAITVSEDLLSCSRRQQLALLALTLQCAPSYDTRTKRQAGGALPVSVQPGIPRLPPCPKGWRKTNLRKHVHEVRRPVVIKPQEEYRLVTVKRSRGGVVTREILPGSEIKTPTQFYVRAGDFLISKRQIVHGACGIVPPELDGAIVSNEYAVLNSDDQIDLRFLRYLSETRYFQQTCFHSSIGVHVEKMIFNTERWLKWPFNIPAPHEQQHIVEVLDTARREVELIATQIDKLKQEKSALMADLLTGRRRVRLPVAEATP